MATFKEMNITELSQFVTEKREELRRLRFGVAGSGMRNTRAIRNHRREIAQALTELNTRSQNPA